MNTEREIIYSIWETVRGGEINADDPINERLLRAYLASHRGKHLSRNYREGAEVPDECFQNIIPELTGGIDLTITPEGYVFKYVKGNFVFDKLPKIVFFKNNEGLRAWIDDYYVPIINSEEWNNIHKTRFGKYHPALKYDNDKLYLYEGMECGDPILHYDTPVNRAVRKIKKEKSFSKKLRIDLQAVLNNPDDGVGYDFARSPYPYPSDLIPDLVSSVTRNDFQVFLSMNSDEVADKRDDTKQGRSNEEF